MSDDAARAHALRPLWMIATGAAVGATVALTATRPGPGWLRTAAVVLGAGAILTALRRGPDAGALLWFLGGLAVVGGRGLDASADRMTIASIAANPSATVRVSAVVIDGWQPSRWGMRARIGIIEGTHCDRRIGLPHRCQMEVRGAVDPGNLPRPGSVVEAVARPAGDLLRPLLVVPGERLLETTGTTRILPALRDRMARSLLEAAGTDVRRIRSAETACAIALGRRDLVPPERRERWRRSGYAHLLAVSGLHVGIVGGTVFLALAFAGLQPRTTRAATLLAIPAYAVLAGSQPSALRAALMASIYIGGRFLGRAVLPMAAVLLATVLLLVADPPIVADAGFQLTVLVTAALVRWVPPLAALTPGPRWLSGAVAVPLVAQAAAAPLVAWHFRSLVPGTVAANLAALPLLGPAVLAAVAAAVLAMPWAGGAAVLLDLLHAITATVLAIGGLGRAREFCPPELPAAAVVLLAVIGWLALQATRRARAAAAAWLVGLAVLVAVAVSPPSAGGESVEVLPVSDGAAILVNAGASSLLADAGRYPRQASELLATAGRRHLDAAIASHGDEDHIGGMVRVLDTAAVEQIVIPSWLFARPEAVPMLRTARRRGVTIRRVARGSVVVAGRIRLEILWPPAHDPPWNDNERSLVAVAKIGPAGSVLLTSDTGRETERRLPAGGRIACDVLVVPHHGSRGGTSERLLDAAAPLIALVPAAHGNTYGHPSPEVVTRLALRGVIVRKPARSQSCGARWNGERWVAFP